MVENLGRKFAVSRHYRHLSVLVQYKLPCSQEAARRQLYNVFCQDVTVQRLFVYQVYVGLYIDVCT